MQWFDFINQSFRCVYNEGQAPVAGQPKPRLYTLVGMDRYATHPMIAALLKVRANKVQITYAGLRMLCSHYIKYRLKLFVVHIGIRKNMLYVNIFNLKVVQVLQLGNQEWVHR